MKNETMNKYESIDNELYCKYGKYDVLDVVEYVLQFCEKELLYPISNSKLQRILYFIQGRYLAKYKRLLFDNQIQAWTCGPVVPDAYYEYRDNGYSLITGVESKNEHIFDECEKEFVKCITREKYKVNDLMLNKETREELPWKNSFEEGKRNEIITIYLYEYFSLDN
jgi:uncharacterized phage-associated protein